MAISAGCNPRSRAAISDGSLVVPIPPGWHGSMDSGFLGAEPVPVVIAANFALPESAAGCEGAIPKLTRRQAIIRVYDYGTNTLAPAGRPAPVLRPGPARAARDPLRRVRGFAQRRTRLAGRTLLVTVSYGALRPPAPTIRRVDRLLAAVRVQR